MRARFSFLAAAGLALMGMSDRAAAQLVIDGQDSRTTTAPGVVIDMSVLGDDAPPPPGTAAAPAATTQRRVPPFVPPLPPRRPTPPPMVASAPSAGAAGSVTAGTPMVPQPPNPQTLPPSPPPAPAPQAQAADTVEGLTPELSTGDRLPPRAPAAGDSAPRPDLAAPDPVPTPTPPSDAGDAAPAAPPIAADPPIDPQPAGDMPEARQTAPPPVADGDGASVDTLPGGGFRIVYEPGSETVPRTGGSLITGLAQRLVDEPDTRVQIRAFASDTQDNPSQARRLSLNRALAIRTLFIDAGVRGTRLDVRALGDTAEDGPRDRVDLLIDP